MRTIFMFSGFDKEKGFYDNQVKYLKLNLKSGLNITFIASNFDNYEKTDKHVNIFVESFNKIDISFKFVNIIDYRVKKEDTRDIITNSDIIFIMGGDTYNEFQYIKEYELVDVIKKFEGVIIGVSAGSLNMSDNVCYLDEYRDYKLVQYKGLGLADINIYPHFDLNDKDFLNETLEVSKYKKLYALPNDSFVIVKNDIKFIGDYYICENMKYEKVENENS